MLPGLAEPARLEQIDCPTMVIVAVEPGQAGQFNQKQPVAEVAGWVARIPNSRLVELAADSYHVAATHPDQCADIARAFIAGRQERASARVDK
jgi:3-oxoadipate enol-lactonase